MIQSPFARKALYFLFQKSDRSRYHVFHEAIRKFYGGPFRAMISLYLKPPGAKRDDFRLKARHSVTEFQEFNVFASDLDLSVIMPDTYASQSELIARRHKRLKKIFPFMGELEIYLQSESEILNRLMLQFGEAYAFVRLIRKLSWSEESARLAPSDYHRAKCERAIRKVFRTQGLAYQEDIHARRESFSAFVTRKIQALFSDSLRGIDLSLRDMENSEFITSDYLATRIYLKPQRALGICELHLSAPVALVLLGLTPRLSFGETWLAEVLVELRRRPAIRQSWKAFSQIECLIFKAVLRGHGQESEEERSWLQQFRDSFLEASLSPAPHAASEGAS